MTTETQADIIDVLVGVQKGDAIDTLRARRPVTRAQAQQSHHALFAPESFSEVSAAERHAVALFVALLHEAGDLAALHAAALGDAALLVVVRRAAEAGASKGPYGRYPAGPLSVEDVPGAELRFSPEIVAALGTRLAAALEHAHLLVFHPRDARKAHIGRLLAAGWSASGVVSLSQLVSFLAFQIRAASGLRVLAAA